jgi:hypothetical protein
MTAASDVGHPPRSLARCLLAAIPIAVLSCAPARPTYVPRDPALRGEPLYFYPAQGTPRAMLFFLGNDVGFWDAHQRLAARVSANGVAVVGLDVRPILQALPAGPPERRASAFASVITRLVTGARRELRVQHLPLLIGGHSIGAELALYTAAQIRFPGLVGVLALSPGLRGHLRVSLGDIFMAGEPTEPGSFAVADEVHALPSNVNVAIIRGQRDPYDVADSALAIAGGTRVKRWMVPFAGHSLKQLMLTWPPIARALSYLLPEE